VNVHVQDAETHQLKLLKGVAQGEVFELC